ncbi:MAG: helix-turn-helix domain-containing protein, partial [Eubacteriaceae bacterium]
GGEVGLILYYVGLYLPKIDQRLIDLANQRDFVLISMPENRSNLRYSEVIVDVMESIVRDRMQADSILTDILDSVSRLPEHQRSITTVLKMLSDRLSASLILTDSSFHILNMTAWPRSIELELKSSFYTIHSVPENRSIPFTQIAGSWIRRTVLYPESGQELNLFLIREGQTLSEEIIGQTADTVRLGLNLWEHEYGDIAVHELVRAILQDEPIRMRRLADIFHVDVASIHEMWIINGGSQWNGDPVVYRKLAHSIAEDSRPVILADLYDNSLLLFLETPSADEAAALNATILELADKQGASINVTRCSGLYNTSDVRKARQLHDEFLKDAMTIYPDRQFFSLGELEFTADCRHLIEEGEQSLKYALSVLTPLESEHEGQELCKTLETYLLDADSSLKRCSELLYIHLNTVKYRIRRMTGYLGFHPGKMPDSIALYRACAIARLVRSPKELD